jgi:uncharacterized protein
MNEAQNIADALLGVIRLMADHPEHASATVTNDAAGIYTIRISTHRTDVGKVVGNQGCAARSFRILASAMGSQANSRIRLDIALQ